MSHVSVAGVSLLVSLLSTIALPAMAGQIQVTGTPPGGTVGKSYYWVPTTTGGNKSTLEFSYVNLPSWSGTYRGSGAIIGTPTKAGVYSKIQIQAWDGVNFGISAPFTITIAGTGSPAPQTKLSISGSPETTAQKGGYYSFTPTVIAPSGAALTYSIHNKPAWTQFNSSTGTLSGTPTAAGEATDIVISVSDGAQTASLPGFDIQVAASVASPPPSAALSWTVPTENTNGTPLTNLEGYVVRYGTSSSNLNFQLSVKTNEVEIGNLTPGTWYFEVAAVNSLNIDGRFSQIVSKQIP